MAQLWDVAVGEHLTRGARRQRFGGAVYGGIEPSAQTPNVFIYSDPERSADIYPYDGWPEDGKTFLYTGEGRLGDQQMQEGNRAILGHKDRGRALRVFVADGTVSGTTERNHLYIGEFEVDPAEPYVQEPAPDDSGETRTVFVFRLRPSAMLYGAPRTRAGPATPPPPPTSSSSVPSSSSGPNTRSPAPNPRPPDAAKPNSSPVTRATLRSSVTTLDGGAFDLPANS